MPPHSHPNHRAKALMIQGTGSSVGKSVIAAAMCRILAQDGIRVAPFKAQNMSNNSYVTADGGEMGRAQVVQAQAAGIEPHTDMNPVLLKPEADSRSQVVLNGKAIGSFQARKYWGDQTEIWNEVTAAYDRLASNYDVIVLEGAGSPAEVNLRDRDIVNMRIAAYADASVILVGDIDRGGVFASLLGTLELLLPEERSLVKATLINRFRGDIELLNPLPEMIADRTQIPVAGVIPFIYDLQVKDEDGVTFGDYIPPDNSDAIEVAVINLPRVSNHDDLDPFRRAGCRVKIVSNPNELSTAHIIIIPGSKSTISDLRWMKYRGLDQAVVNAANRGVTVIGICGGYQMLGNHLDDPHATESSSPQSENGLGLLPVSTVFDTTKTTERVEIELDSHDTGPLVGEAAAGIGYEIHTGITNGISPHDIQKLAILNRTTGSATQSHPDGAISSDPPVFGTYVHGFFDSPQILRRLVTSTARANGLPVPTIHDFSMESEFDRLADTVRNNINLPLIKSLIS